MQPFPADILTLIPQRPPFVMVDKLEHFDHRTTITTFLVRPDNLFVHDGHLLPAGLMENIAQTCAVRMGCINRLAGKDVMLGVIGAVRSLVFHADPPVGAMLTTRIDMLDEVFQMTLVSARVLVAGHIAATAQMKIAILDETSNTLTH